MKQKLRYLLCIIFFMPHLLLSGEPSGAEVYLLTCGPGTETYSIYGHSALRIVIPEEKSDLVYNWGVFDFNTPNFAWKFAKGQTQLFAGDYPLMTTFSVIISLDKDG